jgi:hypothetical protein
MPGLIHEHGRTSLGAAAFMDSGFRRNDEDGGDCVAAARLV